MAGYSCKIPTQEVFFLKKNLFPDTVREGLKKQGGTRPIFWDETEKLDL